MVLLRAGVQEAKELLHLVHVWRSQAHLDKVQEWLLVVEGVVEIEGRHLHLQTGGVDERILDHRVNDCFEETDLFVDGAEATGRKSVYYTTDE